MAHAPSSRTVAIAGLLSLAAAMGIGRFAFTPLLPLMAREGGLDLAFGGWLAAANYVGYFAGALTAARLPLGARALALFALALTAVSTAAMAFPGPAFWLVLRFAAGAASAWVFVATSVWCLAALARAGRGDLGGAVYAGVGGGIALTGLYCVFAAAMHLSAAALWVHLGVLAAVLALPVARVLRGVPDGEPPAASVARSATSHDDSTLGLTVCYGLMGFGYILPATFLPALARSVVDDPRVFGLVWPVFGATAALSTILAGWLMRRATRLQVWAAGQLLMGVGVLLPSLWVNGATVALSALLVGGTFMVITLAGVQEVRARGPQHAPRLVGRITAAFAFGQIAGPVLSAILLQSPALAHHGLALSLQAGAAGLLASGAWLWRRSAPPFASKETRHA